MVNDVDITFQIDGDELIAHPPTSGQLALFLTGTGGGVGAVQSMFDFLDAVLDEEGVDIVREKLQEGVELALITDIINYLIEEWTARPTKSSTASTASRKSTGSRSTAKPRKKAASTR